MLIDSLNLNHLRIFHSVYCTRSMTAASKELHLTQSGVSQHIHALEESLGVKLFDRVNKKIMPTEKGGHLFKKVEQALKDLEGGLMDVTSKEVAVRGIVRVGMPIEFGNNIVIPRLAEVAKEHPEVQFQVTMEFAMKMNQMLLAGELDFAFIDEFQMDRRIEVEPVAEEIFHLCASSEYLKDKRSLRLTKTYFESLDYISYQEGEPVLRSWFGHHLKRKNINMNVRAQVMDVQGVMHFIRGHMGVGVLPDHLVQRIERKNPGELEVIKGSGKPLTNKLSLASLKNRSYSLAAQVVRDAFRERVFPANYQPFGH